MMQIIISILVLTLLVAPGDGASLLTAPGPILGREESNTVTLPPIGCCGQKCDCTYKTIAGLWPNISIYM